MVDQVWEVWSEEKGREAKAIMGWDRILGFWRQVSIWGKKEY